MSPWHTSVKSCTIGHFLYHENTVVPGLSSFFIITGWKCSLSSVEEKDNWDAHDYLEVLRNAMRRLISMFMIKYAHCGIVLTQEVPLQFKQHFIQPLNTKRETLHSPRTVTVHLAQYYLPHTLVPGTRLCGALVQQTVSEHAGHTQTKAGLLT